MQPQITLEVARLIASRPTPEQIIAFHPSQDVVDRAYALLDNKRAGTLTQDEQEELNNYLAIEHLMMLAKAEAHQQLHQRAS